MSSILRLYLHPVSDVFDALQREARIQKGGERSGRRRDGERGERERVKVRVSD